MQQIQTRAGFRRHSPPAACALPLTLLANSRARLRIVTPAKQALHSLASALTPRCGNSLNTSCSRVGSRTGLCTRHDALASRSNHVRVGVLEHHGDDGGSSSSSGSSKGNSGEAWGHSHAGDRPQLPRSHDEGSTDRASEADHSANQITLFLSLSVTLITLPWLYRHPETLLVPLALLAMPMPGSALRPALLEGIYMILSAARWMSDSSHAAPPPANHSTPGSSDRPQQQQQQQQQQQAGSWSSAAAQSQQHHQPSTSSPAAYSTPYPPYPRSTSFHSTHAHAATIAPDARTFNTHPTQHAAHGPLYATSPLRSDANPHPTNPDSPRPHYDSSYESYPSGSAASQAAWTFSMDRPQRQQQGVMDADWPASSSVEDTDGCSSIGGGGGGGGGGSSDSSWQRHVLQNLSGAPDDAFNYPYNPTIHEPSPPPLGPYSMWPQANMYPAPPPYPQTQQPAMHPQPHADPLLPAMHHSHASPQHQHQHQRMHATAEAPPSPLASAERYHDMYQQQQQQQQDHHAHARISSSAGSSEPGAGSLGGSAWHSMLFSVAPWMKSWGGFL